MKLRAFGIGIIALAILGVALFPPRGLLKQSSYPHDDGEHAATAVGESRTSRNRHVVEQQQPLQEELAKQFIIGADEIIAEKRISFGVFMMYSVPDQISSLAEQMDRQTVLRLLDHYSHWNQDVYVCGVCCHLLHRLAQLAPEEALALYEEKIGLSKVTAILKLSDEDDEENLEKNPKAIPTLSLMALASGYQAGKPGSRKLLTAFKETIPWQEISRAITEDEEELVGENGMLCVMIYIGILAEECKVQPDFALAELRALPLNDAMKASILSNLVDDDEIPFRVLQHDVESHLAKAEPANDEQRQLAIAFARRIFGESPADAEKWLTQHKLPLQERSAHELDSLLQEWTTDNHAIFQAWIKQLDNEPRARIVAQKMEQLCVTLSNRSRETPEMPQEYEMLDSLLPHVSSPQLLLLMKNVAKHNHADDDTSFRELLQHLKIPEAEIQVLLEEKNKSE